MPLELKDRKWLAPYVKDKRAISKHAFYPFIHRKIKVRRFRRKINDDGTRSKIRISSSKSREIYFSNHIDSNIFSYYSELLSIEYEKTIRNLNIDTCVTAYRKIKLDSTKLKSRNKCNIDFANDVFKYIKANKGKDLVAITFDIKSFFDSLDHKILKKNWRRVINSGEVLPPDHYNVFRNITKFSFVEENDLFEQYKSQIYIEKKPKKFDKVSIQKRKYFRNKKVVAYCSEDEIDNIRSLGLIKANKYICESGKKSGLRTKGIPQGSPISATLANIYMTDFDKYTNDLISKMGGIYQRYSDDMVAICPIENEAEIIDYFPKTLTDYKLEIQKSKTQIFHFLFNEKQNRHFCFEKNSFTNTLQNNTKFEYLGFQFDGFKTLIKNSSISNYYRKMKRSFARSNFYTYHNKTATRGKVFKSSLYKNFTHLGATRRRIYIRHPRNKNEFRKTQKFDWGNFISYTKLAEKYIIDNKIGNQLKRHWAKFHLQMRKIEKKRKSNLSH